MPASYRWEAFFKDGTVKSGGKLNGDIVEFKLISIVDYLKNIIIKLDSTKELIYFKRVFCSFSNMIDNIIYHVGYKQGSIEKVICVNSITGEINGEYTQEGMSLRM